MFRRYLAPAVAVLFTGLLAGCENTDSWVDAQAAQGWSAQYGDAANSSYVRSRGPEALRLEWSRSVKGELGAQVALSADNRLAVNAQTAGGCSLMVWEADNNARQRWCTRLVLGGGWSSPLFDGFDNVYIGQPGTILSFPPTQWIRWRQPVIGMPTTPRLLDDGQLLVVTHLGQVLVFNGHRGTVEGTPMDLVSGVDPTDSQRGLGDCQPARSRCPVAAAPAFSHQTRIVVLSVWQPGAEAPVLMGLRYHPGEETLLTQEWTSTAVGRGPLASPVLSADGATVYVNGRDQKLWALNSADGTPKWSVPLNYLAQTPPSVSPDGLIVAGGGPEAKLTAVRDTGDHGEIAWTRDDVVPLTTSSRADGVGYTVAREGGHGQSLLVFDTGDGHTLNSYPVPEATGWPVGVSIGHNHRIVTATSDGQVYGFAPA
ncbi:outer membrane protein assembly factor BamB family protein [Mycolicibacterium fortuitum]|uniref:PQQ-binding-like beta-propeller repeat protein n=1 Tax=Mycolicibacterium fortuitum TaxID=1766 RepID=A0AAE5AC38_MYCFO|nr:PQQ-binding-like beta-propeller repeat protein [Mycolicibacterium fortuitum]MCV7138789.1 PQQ-like beta-propeller repeat protein [Mycolicibacterium fortuitum]MDV7189348.1 PQQ-binding-like beta-propeller repeat protein [Mycolicibacterium fortuitum]MDV7202615.1 PQQ-binding-like beta-propeller repeat protein [Mycolicibacterium fortuitum]MDV7224581.1 PQQ-binding-like beta-propeller repeat protein [Mycolicibacterium fortuitum]MDV7256421.1 PQQ-binding-like beta-propeller repeat protein [Mycoliciba